MAKLLQAFDAEEHEDMRGDFEVLAAGIYPMHISASSLEKTKTYADTKNQYIKLEFTIIGGEFKGRKVWQNLNIINLNSTAVKIANEEFAAICKACGKTKVQDTEVLHGVPMNVKLKIKPAKGDYPAQNVPCGYDPAGVQAKKPAQLKVKKKLKKKPTSTNAKPTEDSPGWD